MKTHRISRFDCLWATCMLCILGCLSLSTATAHAYWTDKSHDTTEMIACAPEHPEDTNPTANSEDEVQDLITVSVLSHPQLPSVLTPLLQPLCTLHALRLVTPPPER